MAQPFVICDLAIRTGFPNFRFGEAFEIFGVSHSHRRAGSSQPSNGGTIPIRKLFISHVHDSFTPKDLKNIFEQYGEVHDVSFPKPEQNSKRRFFFVTYYNPDFAKRALTDSKKLKQRYQFFVHPADQWHQPVDLPSGEIQWYRGSAVCQQETVPEDKEICGEDEEEAPINQLNDDCLTHIFTYLSKSQWIGIERVCRRWRDVSLNMWGNVTSLDFDTGFVMPPKTALRNDHLRELLLRCGGQIKALDISSKVSEINPSRVYLIIAKFCTKLIHLDISKLFLIGPRLDVLFQDLGPRLTKLTMNDCKNLDDKALFVILSHTGNLEYLSISRTVVAGNMWQLPPSITTFIADECLSFRETSLTAQLSLLPDLHTLSLNKVFCYPKALGEYNPKLVRLTLRSSMFTARSTLSAPFLPLLQELDVSLSVMVTDEVLSLLVKIYPTLVKLNISGCGAGHGISNTVEKSVTNKGVMMLTKLQKLKWLGISMLQQLTSECLEYWAVNCNGRLTGVACSYLPQLTDTGPCRLIALCTELTFLDLSQCTGLTRQVLDVAYETVGLRTNNTSLTICTFESSIVSESVPDHRLLKVSPMPIRHAESLYFFHLVNNITPFSLLDFESEDDEDDFGYDYEFDSDTESDDELVEFFADANDFLDDVDWRLLNWNMRGNAWDLDSSLN